MAKAQTQTPKCPATDVVVTAAQVPPASALSRASDADRRERAAQAAESVAELSVVIPCLNERETIGTCVAKAVRAMREAGIDGEVIVADNGSTDGSQRIATERGARVVAVSRPGYGSALRGGIEAACGRYIIMGDADDSYDFLQIGKFVERLREGNDLVMGCRLPGGGGRIRRGAMPFLHRWVGNPMFTRLARWMFRSPVNDVYCGLRGFTREFYDRLNLRCTGMEFATEMVIKSGMLSDRIAEVPIVLHPDGRSRKPHLRTFSDGWRTLRFFLLFSPRWTLLAPGLVLTVLGLIGFGLAWAGATIGPATLGAHSLIVSMLAILIGYQSIAFAVSAKVFAIREHLLPEVPALTWLFRWFRLERGLVVAALLMLAGLALVAVAVRQWVVADFGPLDYAQTMRWVVPGVTLIALGFQTMLASLLLSMLRLASD